MKKWQVTIDGPAASGKSIVGKWLANQLNAAFLDTGLHYRAFALYCVWQKINPQNLATVNKALQHFDVQLINPVMIAINGTQVSIVKDLQVEDISKKTSLVSPIPAVRAKLTMLQRQYALQQNTIVVGRDAGTVILPSATSKIFLTASLDERAKRRWLQLSANNNKTDLNMIRNSIMLRDQADKKRAIAPLKIPENSYFLDNSHLSIMETEATLLQHIIKKLGSG